MAIALRGTPQSFAGAGHSAAVNVPSGWVAGDLLMAKIIGFGTATAPSAPTDPAGWTKIGAATTGGTSSTVAVSWYYRVASSEPASYTFASSGGDNWIEAAIIAYSGVDTVSPFNLAGQSAASLSGNPTSVDLGSTTVDGCWHVVDLSGFHAMTGTVSGYTDDNNFDSGGQHTLHKLISPAGATGAKSLTTGGGGWTAWAAALAPAAVVSGAFYQAHPGQTWRRRFWLGIQHPRPWPATPPTPPAPPGTPPIVVSGVRRPPPKAKRSKVCIRPVAVAAPAASPIRVRGIARKPPQRPASDWNTGFGIQALTRSGAQWIQPPPYNSGGLRAQQRVVVRAKPPTRPASDWGGRFPLAVLRSGAQIVQPPSTAAPAPVKPVITTGVRRRNPTRSGYPFPQFIAPAIAPSQPGVASAVVGEQKLPKPTRSRSRLQVAYSSAGPSAALTRGVARRNLVRAASRSLPAPPYNSGGIPPRLALGLRRQAAIRRPQRSGLSVAAPPAAVAAALVVRAAPFRARPVRSAARIVVGRIGAVAGVLGRITSAKRAKLPPLRADSRYLPFQAPLPCLVWGQTQWGSSIWCPGNAVVQTPVVQKARPKRSASRIIPGRVLGVQAPVAGARISAARRPQRQPLNRSKSHLVAASRFNSGGFLPVLVLRGVRRQNWSRPVSDWNSGIGALALTRTGAQWIQAPPYNSGGSEGQLLSGVRRGNLVRGGSRLSRLAPSGLPPGILPAQSEGVRRRNLTRSASRWQSALRYNSGGLAPRVVSGVRRLNLSRSTSHLGRLAPSGPAPGILPVQSEGVRRRNLSRPGSRIRPPAALALAGVVPLLLRATQKPRPSRFSSRLFQVAPGLLQPSVVGRLTRRSTPQPAPRNRSLSHLFAPTFNSGGLKPLQSHGARWKPISRPGSRWAPAPRYNAGGLPPELTFGVKRLPAKVKPSRWLPAPVFNSGGIVPARSQGVRRVNRHRPGSRLKVQAPYNSGGIRPVFRVVPRQKPPTRGRSYRPQTGTVDLGLTRDITVALSSPFSAWGVRQSGSRWRLDLADSRWQVTGVDGRWQLDLADPRWGEKPPEV